MLGMRNITLALVVIGGLGACSDRSRAPLAPTVASPAGVTPPGSTTPAPLAPDFWTSFNMDRGGAYPPGPPSGAGLRYGELKREDQEISWASCLVAETGELACVLTEPSSFTSAFIGPVEFWYGTVVGALHGTIRAVGPEEITGSGKLYAAPGKVLADGVSAVADFTITSGLLSDQNRALELTIESLGEVATLSFDGWDRYYFGISSLIGLSGVYPFFDLFGDPASVTIDTNGALFSQAASGCVVSGQVAIIDPAVNVYGVDVTTSGCSTLNGAYKGLVTIVEIPFDNGITRLKLTVFNDSAFIAGDIVR